MKGVENKTIAKILIDMLVKGDKYRKIDNSPGVFMAFKIDFLGSVDTGESFAFSHTYEERGDIIPDPDMEVIFALDNKIYPYSYQDRYSYKRAWDGRSGWKIELQSELAVFLRKWLNNVVDQQGLK